MKTRLAAVALAAAALVTAACGSSGSSSKATKGATATTAAGGAATTAAGGASGSSAGANSPVSFSATDTTAAKVDRKGETLVVGVTNDEGPSFTVPEQRVGILTAIDYINGHGGINGAVLKPVVCVSDATPEGAVNCADKFVEAKVNLVTYGAEINMDAALKIYEQAAIPILSDFAYNQTPAKNVWALTAPAGSFTLYPLLALRDLGLKKPAYMPIDTPIFHYEAGLTAKWGKLLNIDTVIGPFTDPGNGDWTTAAQTAISKGADSMIFYGPTNNAQALVGAARQLGFTGPIITTDVNYVKAVDATAVRDNYVIFPRYPSPAAAAAAPARIRQNLKTYSDAMTAAGHSDLISGYAENQFATTMDIATILKAIPAGPINLQTITAALTPDRNMIGFDAPDFNCGKPSWSAFPSFCRGYQLVLKIDTKNGAITMTPLKKDNNGFYNSLELAAKSATL